MKLTTSILTTALLLAATAANAGGRDQLNTFTKGLKGLDGKFSQQVFDARGKQKEHSTGRVALSAPRLFRWEYAKPDGKLFVSNGVDYWYYNPIARTAEKMKLKEETTAGGVCRVNTVTALRANKAGETIKYRFLHSSGKNHCQLEINVSSGI